jgi:hypothetical protein
VWRAQLAPHELGEIQRIFSVAATIDSFEDGARSDGDPLLDQATQNVGESASVTSLGIVLAGSAGAICSS